MTIEQTLREWLGENIKLDPSKNISVINAMAGAENQLRNELRERIPELAKNLEAREKITGETSDGYHTFNELYEYRMLYNAAMFNELFRTHQNYDIHKSWRHSDGELAFGGGWFVVVAQLPTGQITNHYEEKDWYLFDIEERDKAAEWDGHTPQDAAKRLRDYTASYESRGKRIAELKALSDPKEKPDFSSKRNVNN